MTIPAPLRSALSARVEEVEDGGRVFPGAPGRPAWLRVAVLRTTAVALLFNVLVVSGSPYLDDPWLPATVRAATFALVGLPGIWVLVDAIRGVSRLASLHAFVVGALGANLVAALGPHLGRAPAGTPYLNATTVVASCLTLSIISSRRVAAAALVLLGTAYAGVRVPAVGPLVAGLEALVTAVGSAVVGLYVRVLAHSYAKLAKTVREAQEESRSADARREAVRLREEWDRVVHDTVLGALTIAARTGSLEALSTARQLAGEALRALGVIDAGGSDRRDLAGLAHGLGLTTTRPAVLPPGLPDEVAASIRAAASEALVNVARHAGVSEVDIEVVGDDREVAVSIRDRGRGFERTATGRLGVTSSIPGHLAQVGGSAVIRSAVGEGTTAELRWSAPPTSRGALSGRQEGPQELPSSALVALLVLWVSAYVALGWRAGHGTLVSAGTGGPGAVAMLTVALVTGLLINGFGRAQVLALFLVSGSVAGLAAVVVPPAHTDWTVWFVGCSLAFPTAAVVHRRQRLAWSYALLTTLGLAVGLASHGFPVVVRLLDLFVHPLATTLLMVLALRALDRSRTELRSSTVQLGRLRQASAFIDLREEVRRIRHDELADDVIPLLELLWSGAPFTDSDRRLAELAEAGARDRLLGGPVLTESLVEGITAARRRGTTVVLRSSTVDRTDDRTRRFAAAATEVLDITGPDSVVTISWHPSATDSAGTVLVARPERPVDPTTLARALGSTHHELDQDDDELWLRVAPGVPSPEAGTTAP